MEDGLADGHTIRAYVFSDLLMSVFQNCNNNKNNNIDVNINNNIVDNEFAMQRDDVDKSGKEKAGQQRTDELKVWVRRWNHAADVTVSSVQARRSQGEEQSVIQDVRKSGKRL